MNSSKTVDQKALRKNRKTQRHLSGKDDPESMRKLDLLMKEEKEILQKMECDKEKKGKRVAKRIARKAKRAAKKAKRAAKRVANRRSRKK